MDVTPSTPPLEAEPTIVSTSVMSRIVNMFVSPGEVFDEVRETRRNFLNWFLPTMLMAIISVVTVNVMFSQPAILQNIREQQDKQFEKMVAEKKMTREQADGARAQMEKLGPTFMKIAGSISALFFSFVGLFAIAGIIAISWAALAPTHPGFGKAMEVAGLCAMIPFLGAIAGIFTMMMKGHIFGTLGPALFISEFNPENKLHLLLSSLNIMTIWYLFLLSLGISTVGRIRLGKAATIMFGLWALYRVIVIGKGWGASGM